MAARDLDRTTRDDTVDFQTLVVAGRVGSAAAVKFRVWLDHYRHIEPLIDELVKTGKHPPIGSMETDRQIVTAIASVNAVAQATKKPCDKPEEKEKLKAEVHRIAKNVFGFVAKFPSDFQIAAIKSTLNMNIVQEFQLTKVPEVMTAYMNMRKAMKDS